MPKLTLFAQISPKFPSLIEVMPQASQDMPKLSCLPKVMSNSSSFYVLCQNSKIMFELCQSYPILLKLCQSD
jgi:hypothetical protein